MFHPLPELNQTFVTFEIESQNPSEQKEDGNNTTQIATHNNNNFVSDNNDPTSPNIDSISLFQVCEEAMLSTEHQTYFSIERQPEPFQRKCYVGSTRKETRYFKPQVIRIFAHASVKDSIQNATAVMHLIDDNMEIVSEDATQIQDIDNRMKCFSFTPTSSKTSNGKKWRLQFTINFLLEDGRQKTEIIMSDKFRIVSRITQTHRKELAQNEN